MAYEIRMLMTLASARLQHFNHELGAWEDIPEVYAEQLPPKKPVLTPSLVRSGCAVRDVMQGDPIQSDLRNEAVEAMRQQYNAAIEYALKLSDPFDPGEAVWFLRAWSKGDTSEWPEFKGPIPNTMKL